ncbi:response regulator [Flammeovirga sp. SubArs3]|uniref:response regulator n=1 Tax=Flammeovirga sp. SubArs3 TaxID=2995316 RepID=UPI00248AEF72|nr:response regulator [Flammeovirga sp. SubArs3]
MKFLIYTLIIFSATSIYASEIDSLRTVFENSTPSNKFSTGSQYYNQLRYSKPNDAVSGLQKLITEAESANNINAEIDLYDILAKTYLIKRKLDSLYFYFEKVEQLSKESNNNAGLGKAYSGFSLYYNIKNKEECLTYFDKAVQIFKEEGMEIPLADIYNSTGLYYRNHGNYDEAMELFKKARLIYELHDHKMGLFKVVNNEALIWKNLSVKDKELFKKYIYKAIEMFKLAEKYSIDLNNKHYQATVVTNIGGAYDKLSSQLDPNTETEAILETVDYRIRYFKKALQLRNELDQNCFKIGIYPSIAEAYRESKKYDSAMLYIDKGIALDAECETKDEDLLYVIQGHIEYDQQHYNKAITAFKKSIALSKKTKNLKNEVGTTGMLGQAYFNVKDYKNAYLTNRIHDSLSQAYLNLEKFEKIAKLEANYEVVKKEEEKLKAQLTYNEELAKKQNLILFSIILIITFAGGGVFYYKSYKDKDKEYILSEGKRVVIEHKQRLLIENEKRLKELDEFKSRFFSNISHEFRTPLTLILSAVTELRTKSKHSPLHLKTIERQSKQLLSLINQILDLSSLENNKKQKVKLSEYSINDTFKVMLGSFESFAEQNEVNFSWSVLSEDKKALMDLDKLTKVINNLVFNAFKFTHPQDEINVTLKEQNDRLSIEVYDTGEGIPAVNLDKIFDQYYHSESGLAASNGIGLALTSELIKTMGGSISVDSVEGQWSRFTITILLRKEDFEAENIDVEIIEPVQLEPVISESSTTTLEKTFDVKSSQVEVIDAQLPTIVVIDDNKDILQYLERMLNDEYNVITAENGEVGIEQTLRYAPDLVISDLMMPKVNGLEVLDKLKAEVESSHIPVVLLTAKADLDTKLEGYSLKADAFVTKPFEKQELLLQVKSLINNRKLIQEKFSTNFMLKKEIADLPSEDEKLIKNLTSFVEENLDNTDLSVDEVANHLGMSRSQLHRKVKAISGQSSSVFIRNIRLRYAHELVLNTDLTMAEISFRTGFNTPNYFTKCFNEYYHVTPNTLRKEVS